MRVMRSNAGGHPHADGEFSDSLRALDADWDDVPAEIRAASDHPGETVTITTDDNDMTETFDDVEDTGYEVTAIAASDIFLDWHRTKALDSIECEFYVRHLKDWKRSALVAEMGPWLSGGRRSRPCSTRTFAVGAACGVQGSAALRRIPARGARAQG